MKSHWAPGLTGLCGMTKNGGINSSDLGQCRERCSEHRNEFLGSIKMRGISLLTSDEVSPCKLRLVLVKTRFLNIVRT